MTFGTFHVWNEGGAKVYGSPAGFIQLYLLGDGTATYKRKYEAIEAGEKEQTVYATLECK